MDTPSQTLAQRITERLVREGLLTEQNAKAIQTKLADGTLQEEDWRLPIEVAIKGEVNA